MLSENTTLQSKAVQSHCENKHF